ncbi:hypothetical protein QFZ28_000991 [Neobacillus niacini]|nr:hypothetical protein [Neobacillus niacini]
MLFRKKENFLLHKRIKGVIIGKLLLTPILLVKSENKKVKLLY